MNDFNETSNAINSNFEERTSSMSDYSTSTTPNGTRYQENTPTITPEIVDAGSELKAPDVDDENNPIVLLSEKLPETEKYQLSDDECAFTREEAEALTQDLQLKYRDTIEAHYNLIAGVRKAHDGHIWLALGYPQGAAGWKAYCKDYFKASAVKLTREQRDNLILGLVEPNADETGDISNTDIAILLGVDRRTVDRVKTKAGITQTGRVRGADGKLRHVDTGSMSSEERRKKIVELSEEGAKQTDIAEILDVSQSTVSDTLRKDRMRRMSEGLEPAKIDNTDFDNADDDQPLDLDMGNRETDIRSYIDSFVSQSSDARGAINEMVHLLESDKWQPGGSTVSEIVSRGGANIFGIISDMCKMLRLLNIDVDNVFDGADAELDDTDNDWSRFIDGCTELAIVCQEITA